MNIVNDISSLFMTEAILQNFKYYLRHFNPDVYETEKIFATKTKINNYFVNNVLQDHIDKKEMNEVISQIVSYYDGLSFTWWIHEEDNVGDIDKELKSNGFRYIGDMITLAINIDTMEKNFDSPNSLYVQPITDIKKIKEWGEIVGPLLNLRKNTDKYIEMYNGVNLLEVASNYQKYIGWLAGEPASASTLITYGGIAGIYDDGVQPYYSRGHGLDAAVVYYPLKKAREAGYKVGFVNSTIGNIKRYKQLGFSEIGKFSKFVYTPRVKRRK